MVSVIWFFLFGGYLIHTLSESVWADYRSRLQTCYQTLDAKTDRERLLDDDEISKRERAKVVSEFHACTASVRVGEIPGESLLGSLLLTSGTIFFGWIAVMSAVSVTRWIKKGFA